MNDFIAERKLFYAAKGTNDLKEFSIKISKPFFVDSAYKKSKTNDDDITGCNVIVEGITDSDFIPYADGNNYGIDSVQAINIASNIEPLIKWISKQYDVYWNIDEPYFDD
jgi:hypothetical protein